MANGVSGTKGASPAASSEAPVNTLKPTGEIDPWSMTMSSDQIAWLKQNTEGIKDYAKTLETIHNFTGSWSSDIRAAQKKGDTTSDYGRAGVRLEDYISKATQWDNSRDLHRGMTLDESVVKGILDGISSGKTYDINYGGTASWSTKYAKSESFCYGKGVKVIFRTKKMKKATPVMHLSSVHGEMEVLSSKDNMFKPISAKKKMINGKEGWLIDVEQV